MVQAGEDERKALAEQAAQSKKAQELLQALNIVNAHHYIVRQDPDGTTETPERISASAEPIPAAQTSDLDGDSSGSDEESLVSQQASPEVSRLLARVLAADQSSRQHACSL